jgi:hypothetical protein
LDEHQAWPPARAYGYLHSDALRTNAPAFRAAIQDVQARMSEWLANVDVRVSRDWRSALVVGEVNRPVPIDELRASVLAAGTANPQVSIEETGEISSSEARDRQLDRDLQRAEYLSIPVSLLVLLALTAVAAAFGLLGPIRRLRRDRGRARTGPASARCSRWTTRRGR